MVLFLTGGDKLVFEKKVFEAYYTIKKPSPHLLQSESNGIEAVNQGSVPNVLAL